MKNKELSEAETWNQARTLISFHLIKECRIDTFFKPLKKTSKRERSIVLLLGIVINGISLRTVDSRLFQLMLSPCCQLASGTQCEKCSVQRREALRKLIVPVSAVITRLLQEKLALMKVTQLSLTMDGWSDRQHSKYLAITGHCMDEDFKPFAFLMDIQVLPLASDHASMLEAVKKTTNAWKQALGLESSHKELIYSMTTDNEAATVLAAQSLMGADAEEDRCFAHTVQLCIAAAEKRCEEFKELVQRINELSSQLLHSKCRDSLSIARTGSAGPSTAARPSPTRWSSQFYTLQRFQELQQSIEEVRGVALGEEFGLSKEEMELLEDSISLLSPFELVTRLSEGDAYATIAFVPSWIHKLQGVADLAVRGAAADLQRELCDQVEKRMARFLEVKIDDKGQPQAAVALCAAAVHPLHFELPTISDADRDIVYKCVEVHAEDFLDSIELLEPSPAQFGSLRRRMKLFVEAGGTLASQFWNQPKVRAHPVRPLAKLWLAIPATSATSERVFSCAGFVDKVARHRTAPVNLIAKTMIRFNAPRVTADQQELAAMVTKRMLRYD